VITMKPVAMILIYGDGSTKHMELEKDVENSSGITSRRKRCPKCHELFHPHGYGPHIKACTGGDEGGDEAIA